MSDTNWSIASSKGKRTQHLNTEKNSNNTTDYVPPTQKVITRTEKLVCEDAINEDQGDKKKFNSSWTVWRHWNDNADDWSLKSYERVYKIDSIGKFWKFFNNFNLLDKIKYQIFIMRGEITPLWEDTHNKYGGICSIKIDYFNNKNRNEIGSEIMTCIALLTINETLITTNSIINGISYAVKNKSIFIKLWINEYKKNINFIKLLPMIFLQKLDATIKMLDRSTIKTNNKVSVQFKEIIPEY